jgi:hypothetical protein
MIKPSIFQNFFKKHLKNPGTPLKKMAEDIDPSAFEGYMTIRKVNPATKEILSTNVVKNKLTSLSKSTIIRLLAQESSPWRPATFNANQYRINKIRFGNSYDGAYAITQERKFTGNPAITFPSRDIVVPIYSDGADLQRNYYNLYEPSIRPGAPVDNNLVGLTLAQKKTAYTNLQNNAPKLSFQNIAAATWNSGKIELSLGNSFTNFGLNNPLAKLDGRDDINLDYPAPFPNVMVDVYNTVTGKILQRLVFKNIKPSVAGVATTYGADYTKGSFAIKPSVYMIDGGTDPSGFGNMFVKMPLHGTGATTPDFNGGAGDTGAYATYMNNPANASYDLLLDPSAGTLYEEFTNETYLGDIESKLYFDFTQDTNGNFNGWKLVLDIAIGGSGEGIGSVAPSVTERSFLTNGLDRTIPSADANWAQVNLGIGLSYERGYYNIVNSIVPKSGINNLQFSSNWNNNLNLDGVFTASYKNRFGTSKDYYEVGNLKGFTVGADAAFINDFETSYSIIMGVNDGNGSNPIDGVLYTEAFLCCENDDVFSSLRFNNTNDRFTKNNSSTYFITWSIRAPL